MRSLRHEKANVRIWHGVAGRHGKNKVRNAAFAVIQHGHPRVGWACGHFNNLGI